MNAAIRAIVRVGVEKGLSLRGIVGGYQDHNPVLVDDIAFTGFTMFETIGHLLSSSLPPPVCIGIHAVFANDAFEMLMVVGIKRVVNFYTIFHPFNMNEMSAAVIDAITRLIS